MAQAEGAVRKGLEVRRKLLAGGHPKGDIERYLARNCAALGRVLAATGKPDEAEQSYREALNLQDQSVEAFPENPFHQEDRAATLVGLADLVRNPSRRRDVEDFRRRAISQYEALKTDFPENPHHRRHLVRSYLKLVSLLWEFGRQSEAAEPYRKALAVDPADADVNNLLAWFLATNPEPRLRDPSLAVRLATKAVAAEPQSPDYQNTLGVAHYRNGDDRAAVSALETAMRLRAGGDSFDWFFLAMAHWRLGDREQAHQWFDRAARGMDKQTPPDEELRRFRAEAMAVLGEAVRP
jgi:tetratricopeptide (TPR) repeat protein